MGFDQLSSPRKGICHEETWIDQICFLEREELVTDYGCHACSLVIWNVGVDPGHLSCLCRVCKGILFLENNFL